MARFVEDVDRGYLALRKRWRRLALNDEIVDAGIVGKRAQTQHPESDLTVAEIGAVHEFGTEDGRVPARSFIRSTFDKNRKKYRNLTRRIGQKVEKDQMSKRQALNLFGTILRDDMIDTINQNIPPPLKPRTLKKKEKNGKAGNVALVDTGLLKASIDFEVRKPRT